MCAKTCDANIFLVILRMDTRVNDMSCDGQVSCAALPWIVCCGLRTVNHDGCRTKSQGTAKAGRIGHMTNHVTQPRG
jgi:hypothetical protein